MKKKVFPLLAAFLPLMVVNGYCLAANYFEPGNSVVNRNVTILFLVISLLISVSKLFFDFFATVVTCRCVKLEPDSGKTLDDLMWCMIPQWIFTLVGLVISRLLFSHCTQVTDLLIFATAHTIYYGTVAYRQIKATGKKAFGVTCGAIALVCWGYAIVNLVKLAAM